MCEQRMILSLQHALRHDSSCAGGLKIFDLLVHTEDASLQHFINKFFCFIFHVCPCHDFVPATFPRYMSLQNVCVKKHMPDFVAETCPCVIM